MKIIEALKSGEDIRIVCGFRWLIWNEIEDCWMVYSKEPYQKKTRMIIQTEFEEVAIFAVRFGQDKEKS